MKHLSKSFAGLTNMSIISAIAIISLSSCQKDLKSPKDDTLRSTPLPTTGTYCRIESIHVESDGLGPAPFDWNFQYDDYENPVSITPTIPLQLYRPTYSFKYDSWHRLIEYQVDGTGNVYSTPRLILQWSFYGFDLNGRIAYDTSYFMVALGEDLSQHKYGYIHHYEYDNQGRRVHDTVQSLDPTSGGYTSDITYDQNGNSIGLGGLQYDDKLNINRTNDIWMLLLSDYSMNNHFFADAYNSAGYPTFVRHLSWLTGGATNAEIHYGCRQSYYY